MKILGHATYIGHTGYNSHCQNFFKALNKTHQVKIRNFTVGKNWKGLQAPDPHNEDANELDKRLIARQSLWENNILKDFDIYAGAKDYAHDLNIVLAEVNHYYFYQNYSGPKIAYTVWESTIYPQSFFNKLKEYDQVWVPSKWQAEITAKQGIEESKIKIIPEGVDSSLFYPEDLKYEDDKFRFLIFGRWDNRKSIKELIKAFKNVFGHYQKVELVISVDNLYSADGMNSTEERLKFYNIDSSNIKILHFPKKEEYAKYLKRGHVFLSCSRSEGWNLPLIEAMACGIPSLYSNCSGQLEFAQGKGIPVNIKGERSASLYADSYSKNQTIGNWYEPDFKDLEIKILEVYNNYNFYKTEALKDSFAVRNEFTWDNAAKKADEATKELFKKKIEGFNFETFFGKYRGLITKSGYSRVKFYEYIIPKLVAKNKPIYILETGTMWEPLERNTGAFTLVMADLIKNITGGKIYSIDISPDSIEKSKKNTEGFHEAIEFVISDSVSYIKNLNDESVQSLDLVYLDSYDFSFPNPHPSAQHHLDELCAIYHRLNDDCGVGIDDNFLPNCWVEWLSLNKDGRVSKKEIFHVVDGPRGKGEYCDLKLTNEGWRRFIEFDDFPNSNIFYYERGGAATDNANQIEVINESGSLGDAIAWVPIVNEFAIQRNTKVNLYGPFKNLFEKEYPLINFLDYSKKPKEITETMYSLGCFDSFDYKSYSLQGLACKILGLEEKEIKPKLTIKKEKKTVSSKKYVCIATQSTAQCKYWNNKEGWNKVVSYLNSLGYDVVCIDKHYSYGVKGSMNIIPENVIDKTGDLPLEDRINDLYHCEFFIGLSSGLSWLAWACEKPVVMISGFSDPKYEFYTPYRVHNKNVCNSCWSDVNCTFDRGNWMWCPRNKNFECSKEISADMVLEQIKKLI